MRGQKGQRERRHQRRRVDDGRTSGIAGHTASSKGNQVPLYIDTVSHIGRPSPHPAGYASRTTFPRQRFTLS